MPLARDKKLARTLLAALASALAAASPACGAGDGGGAAPDAGPDGAPDGGDGGTSDGGSDGGTGGGIAGWLASDPVNPGGAACSPPIGLCPSSGPKAGTACPGDGLKCTYMHPQNVDCLVVATCYAGLGWTLSAGTEGCEPRPASCPASAEAASGASCSTVGSECRYNGIVCRCVSCQVTGCSSAWSCSQTSSNAGCPRVPPRLSPCCPEGLRCSYGPCEAPVVVKCVSGQWARQFVGRCL